MITVKRIDLDTDTNTTFHGKYFSPYSSASLTNFSECKGNPTCYAVYIPQTFGFGALMEDPYKNFPSH